MSLLLSLISLTMALSFQIYRFCVDMSSINDKPGLPAECIAIILEVIVWLVLFRNCLLLIR